MTKCVLLERSLLVKQKLPTFRMELKIFLDQRLFCFYFPESVAREIRYRATFETAFMLSSNMGLWSEIKFPMIMNS